MSKRIFSAPPPVAPDAAPPKAAAKPAPAAAGKPDTRPMVHAATRIDTPDGPRAVETLQAGDRICCSGSDVMSLRAVERVVLARADWAYAPALWPIRVPVGTLGNHTPMRVSPGMRVLLPGEDGAFVRVADLVGIGGIARDRPMADIRYFELHLPEHALVQAEGALIESFPEGPRAVRPETPRDEARAAFATATGRPVR
ncbi:Hint domain-containing protein [Jannaschia sp. W003]|uniref:Hint domain-containing protein n=1 Tax=Jannaschia sp. W003 TaxID=2867012 RepID=UPI0021A7B184|nr:Hint domain-containing protein [Jannaschia sp. W003]UWQ20353.1 Hint domain-containing protein [Jannaschia sp. W003]